MLIDDLTNGLADHVLSSCIACSPHASTPENEVCSFKRLSSSSLLIGGCVRVYR